MLKTEIYRTSLEDHVTIRPITLDDYAAVRYVHKASLKRYGQAFHGVEDFNAGIDEIYTSTYVETLLGQHLYGAFFDRELVGTAGWQECREKPHHALLTALHVQPLFAGCGLGRTLVRNAERRAVIGRHQTMGVEANRNMADFFAHMGYEFVAYKNRPLPSGGNLPFIVMDRTNLDTLTDFGDGLLPPTRMPPIC